MADTNLQKYLAFLYCVEHGSFTAAARQLHYSQANISRMVADLEQDWGVVLLKRDHNGVMLTSEGLQLFPYIQALGNSYQALQEQLEQVRNLQSGLIRIGTFSSVATHWLPNLIKEFQKTYPNIHFEILLGDYTEIQHWIASSRVDCGFLPLLGDIQLETISLGQDKLMVVLPEGHPLAGQGQFPHKALLEYPFILLEKGEQSEIRTFFQDYDLPLRPCFVTLDDYAIMSMVESGLGISILPQLILQRCPYRIVQKELDVPAYREICFAFRSQDSLSLAARRFLDCLGSLRL